MNNNFLYRGPVQKPIYLSLVSKQDEYYWSISGSGNKKMCSRPQKLACHILPYKFDFTLKFGKKSWKAAKSASSMQFLSILKILQNNWFWDRLLHPQLSTFKGPENLNCNKNMQWKYLKFCIFTCGTQVL